MFTWGDLHDVLGIRIRHLGVDDDVLDLLMVGYGLLQSYVDTWDLAAYVVQHDALFVTQTGARSYAVPDDFGRLLHPRDPLSRSRSGGGDCGIQLYGSLTQAPLTLGYREALEFRQKRSTTYGRPQFFTLGHAQGRRVFVLDPAPDANGGAGYIGAGAYVARVERPDLDHAILLDQPTLLLAGVLAQVAVDRGLPQAPLLHADYRRQLSAMVADEHRKLQEFWGMRYPPSRN